MGRARARREERGVDGGSTARAAERKNTRQPPPRPHLPHPWYRQDSTPSSSRPSDRGASLCGHSSRVAAHDAPERQTTTGVPSTVSALGLAVSRSAIKRTGYHRSRQENGAAGSSGASHGVGAAGTRGRVGATSSLRPPTPSDPAHTPSRTVDRNVVHRGRDGAAQGRGGVGCDRGRGAKGGTPGLRVRPGRGHAPARGWAGEAGAHRKAGGGLGCARTMTGAAPALPATLSP